MNEAETTLFLELMSRFSDLLSSAGSNDFEMAVTPENEAFIREMRAGSEDWDEDYDLKQYGPYPARKDVKVYLVTDSEVLRYLVRKITGKEIE